MTLYDNVSDVVRKAIVGKGLTPESVAAKAGISPSDMMRVLRGETSESLVTAISPVLDLNPGALIALPCYQPEACLPSGVTQFPLPFEDEEVNVWLIECDGVRLAIDSGFRSDDFLSTIEKLNNVHLLITHDHRDHVGGLIAAASRLASIHAPAGFPQYGAVAPGKTIEIGPFLIRSVDLSGHHPSAVGYFIDGLAQRLLAAGDAIFAGSMGGCANANAFANARKTIESAISGADDELIILPGHGPATTLGSERMSNPFLAEWLT